MASGPPSAAGAAQRGPPVGPPYAPQIQTFGGLPVVVPDIPLCSVFLFLYLIGAMFHMIIFQKNRKQGSLFVMSAMTFGFCMCRLITFSLRIAWVYHPKNIQLAMASNIFVFAGTPILYIINLVFAHRIIRAQHPRLGWHTMLSLLARLTVLLIILVLVALITVAVQQFYTLDADIHRMDRDVQLFGTTFYTFIAFLPIPMIIIGLVIPRRIRVEKFGKGRFRTKIAVLVTSTLLLTFRAIWGTTTAWLPSIPRTSPIPFYYSKPVFYTVQILTELLVVYLYAFVRVDRRFYTPTGQRNSYMPMTFEPNISFLPPSTQSSSKKTGSRLGTESRPDTKSRPGTEQSMDSTIRVYSEEELFEDHQALADTLRYSCTSLQLDRKSGQWQLKRTSHGSLYVPEWYGFSEVGSNRQPSLKTRGYTSRWSESCC